MGADRAVPYTSEDETSTKRSTGVARIASSRICVPSTFVVTNSDAPSRIDFSTWDSAAAFTITSTPSTSSRTSSASRMSPRMAEHVGEVLEVACVGQRVEGHDLVRRLGEQVANEPRRDEAGAAGYEHTLHPSSSATAYNGIPSTSRWILARYSPI